MDPVTRNMVLFSYILYILSCSFGSTKGDENQGVPKKYVLEGDSVTVDCNFGGSLEDTVVHWKNKDGKEVFFFEHGKHSENGQAGQDEQYRGRASLFYGELRNGNASMVLRDTRIEDTGNYTCVLPRVTPEGQKSTTELIVEPVYKNRFGLKKGAVHRPVLGITDVTDAGVELQCVVTGSSSEPSLEWQTCEGTALSAEKPLVSETRGRYDATCGVTVTEATSNCFRCVVRQADIYHVINSNITVPRKLFDRKSSDATHGHATYGGGHGCDVGLLIGVGFCGVVIGVVFGLLAFHLFRRFHTTHAEHAPVNEEFEMEEQEQEDVEVILISSYSVIGEIEGGVLLEILRYDGVKVLYKMLMSRRGSLKSAKSAASGKSFYCNDSS